MALTVRPATAADLDFVARLFSHLGVPDPPPDAEAFAQRMLPRVLIACDGEDRLGYAFWQRYGNTAHLVHLVTDPQVRGRGVGAALMAAVGAAAVGEGCRRWYLNVKRDNLPAVRLYERCGLAVDRESWALRLAWADVGRLPDEAGTEQWTPEPTDDERIATRFGLEAARLASWRARPDTYLVALRDGDSIVAFATFDRRFPGAAAFRVARPSLARPLIEACRRHADLARFDFLRLVVEGDLALKDALVAAGAEVGFALLQMGASLAQ